MLSGPGALRRWSRLMTWFISLMVNAVSFSCGLLRFAKLFSTPRSLVLSCGVNTSVFLKVQKGLLSLDGRV